MELLDGRHPEIGMWLQLPVKPRCSGLLRSNTQEVRTCVLGNAVEVVSVGVVAVAVVTVTVVAIPVVAVVGFKWPVPSHRPIFSILDLKIKPEAPGCNDLRLG
jgi:hypothetical protein